MKIGVENDALSSSDLVLSVVSKPTYDRLIGTGEVLCGNTLYLVSSDTEIDAYGKKIINVSTDIENLSCAANVGFIYDVSAHLSTEIDSLSASLSSDIDNLSNRVSAEVSSLSD